MNSEHAQWYRQSFRKVHLLYVSPQWAARRGEAFDAAAYADAYEASQAVKAETGAVEIHAYDQPATVAGQGTVAREIERQTGGVDTVLVAVGGGGLIAG
ncbi:MAG: pyridoxal-phosphate dependent enzyme, partial [Gammaproteobacteria bacterium]|nr:pyridoxal-phosphate dependent enzyme [Gammaproteobacteria bacterium]